MQEPTAAALTEDPAQPVVAAFGDVVVAADQGAVEPAGLDALGAREQHERAAVHRDAVGDAVAQMVKFKAPAAPNEAWRRVYQKGLRDFAKLMKA